MRILYEARIVGQYPGILFHNIDGGFVDSPARTELQKLHSLSPKAKKEPANVARGKELEWELCFYAADRNGERFPIIPQKLIRGAIHNAAKLSRDGQRVNRGILVLPEVTFEYPPNTGMSIAELAQIPAYRHEAVVAVQRQRILRVRPLFPEWASEFRVSADDELASEESLRDWLTTAGELIGLGDWRIDKGGAYGGFKLESLSRA